MSANRLSPDQFGIRVQSHPDTLIVTAMNKMRNSTEIEHRVSFSAYDAETPFLNKAKSLNIENVLLASNFVESLGEAQIIGRKKNRFIWSKVNKEKIYSFLSKLNISDMNLKFIEDSRSRIKPLINFIGENNIEELREWDISIPQGEGKTVGSLIPNLSNFISNITCRNRKFEIVSKNVNYLKTNRQKVGDTSDELAGMADEDIENAKTTWHEECVKDSSKFGKAIPAYIYRLFRARPLLTINFIGLSDVEPGDKNMMSPDVIESKVMVAISLSFPDFDKMGTKYPNSKVVYRLNKIAMEELFGPPEEEVEDED